MLNFRALGNYLKQLHLRDIMDNGTIYDSKYVNQWNFNRKECKRNLRRFKNFNLFATVAIGVADLW